ncbi:MAG: hypothetical protein GXP54_06565 [Deltaproteobacteria bacterium]|nr:hypothetical protein [Deltaproteobacteria bacterium]
MTRLRMLPATVMAITLIGLPAWSARAQTGQPGCVKDIECKGDRICEDGRCVFPPAPEIEAPVPQPPVPPEPAEPETADQPPESDGGLLILPEDPGFFKYYVTFGWAPISVQIMDWDDYEDRPDRGIVSLFPFNFRVAGYCALSENIYLGGFFTYEKFVAHADAINSMDTVALGLSARLGGRLSRSLWAGINLDIGATLYRDGTLAAFKKTVRTSDYSLYLFPAFALVKSFGSEKGFNGGIEFMMGLEIYAAKQASFKDHGAYQHFSFGPSIRLGFLFGGI